MNKRLNVVSVNELYPQPHFKKKKEQASSLYSNTNNLMIKEENISQETTNNTIRYPINFPIIKEEHDEIDISNNEFDPNFLNDSLSEVDCQNELSQGKDSTELSQHDNENNSHQTNSLGNNNTEELQLATSSKENEYFLPNLQNNSGKYGFEILMSNLHHTTPSSRTHSWFINEEAKKLYTNMNRFIPFKVKCTRQTNKKFYLRAMPVYKDVLFLNETVLRCPIHLNPSDPTNLYFYHDLNHLIRADDPRAIYDDSFGRFSVLVPLFFPENQSEAAPVKLKFMCHNSCVGGINRRTIVVIFTLLDKKNKEEYGRFVLNVRVCSCPFRDLKNDTVKVSKSRATSNQTESNNLISIKNNINKLKSVCPVDGEDELYFIPVRGNKLYSYLLEMKSLYLKHHPDYAAQYPDMFMNNSNGELLEYPLNSIISTSNNKINNSEIQCVNISNHQSKRTKVKNMYKNFPKKGQNSAKKLCKNLDRKLDQNSVIKINSESYSLENLPNQIIHDIFSEVNPDKSEDNHKSTYNKNSTKMLNKSNLLNEEETDPLIIDNSEIIYEGHSS